MFNTLVIWVDMLLFDFSNRVDQAGLTHRDIGQPHQI